MAREALSTRLRALAGPAARERLVRALAGSTTRARRVLAGPQARERVRLGWAAVRRRPDTLLAAGVVLGVLVMLLHWS